MLLPAESSLGENMAIENLPVDIPIIPPTTPFFAPLFIVVSEAAYN
ncbi:MAG: hypothetical protein ACI9U5_000787 [Colwellia sp.]|jgi:hypothetical protein